LATSAADAVPLNLSTAAKIRTVSVLLLINKLGEF
jgi:hypothetical protein